MDFKIVRTAQASVGSVPAIPLRNLPVAKELDGELVGDAYFIEGKELKEISARIYTQAKAQGVDVALRTDTKRNGVLVFRIKKPKTED